MLIDPWVENMDTDLVIGDSVGGAYELTRNNSLPRSQFWSFMVGGGGLSQDNAAQRVKGDLTAE